MPLAWSAAGVHENESRGRVAVCDGVGHGGVPGKTTDVIDDLGAGADGRARGGAVVGIDGEEGLGPSIADGFEHREKARLFLIGSDWLGVGPGRLCTNIEDVGSEVEKIKPVPDGYVGG